MTYQFFTGWIVGILTVCFAYVVWVIYSIYKEERQEYLENKGESEWQTKQ